MLASRSTGRAGSAPARSRGASTSCGSETGGCASHDVLTPALLAVRAARLALGRRGELPPRTLSRPDQVEQGRQPGLTWLSPRRRGPTSCQCRAAQQVDVVRSASRPPTSHAATSAYERPGLATSPPAAASTHFRPDHRAGIDRHAPSAMISGGRPGLSRKSTRRHPRKSKELVGMVKDLLRTAWRSAGSRWTTCRAAKEFYADSLGPSVTEDNGMLTLHLGGDARSWSTPSPTTPRPLHRRSTSRSTTSKPPSTR